MGIDDICNLHLWGVNDYGFQKKRDSCYFLDNTDSCSKFGWTFPLKKQKWKKVNQPFWEKFDKNQRTPKLIEIDGKKTFNNSSELNHIINIVVVHQKARYLSKSLTKLFRESSEIQFLET